MSVSRYYGHKIGAVVEKKGRKLTVTIGSVYRYTASERETTDAILKFTPRTFLLNKEGAAIAAELSSTYVSNWKHGVMPEYSLGDYDRILYRFSS